MNKLEIIEKLNQNNNFHLSLKVISSTQDSVLYQIKEVIEKENKSAIIITDIEGSYEKLQQAYQGKIDYVLVNSQISFLLPLVNIITNDDISVIKPMIPTFYHLKDNRIIQKVKTTCNKKMSSYYSFKTLEELIYQVMMLIEQ